MIPGQMEIHVTTSWCVHQRSSPKDYRCGDRASYRSSERLPDLPIEAVAADQWRVTGDDDAKTAKSERHQNRWPEDHVHSIHGLVPGHNEQPRRASALKCLELKLCFFAPAVGVARGRLSTRLPATAPSRWLASHPTNSPRHNTEANPLEPHLVHHIESQERAVPMNVDPTVDSTTVEQAQVHRTLSSASSESLDSEPLKYRPAWRQTPRGRFASTHGQIHLLKDLFVPPRAPLLPSPAQADFRSHPESTGRHPWLRSAPI